MTFTLRGFDGVLLAIVFLSTAVGVGSGLMLFAERHLVQDAIEGYTSCADELANLRMKQVVLEDNICTYCHWKCADKYDYDYIREIYMKGKK